MSKFSEKHPKLSTAFVAAVKAPVKFIGTGLEIGALCAILPFWNRDWRALDKAHRAASL